MTSSHHDSDEDHEQEDLEDSEDDWKPEKVRSHAETISFFYLIKPLLFVVDLIRKKVLVEARGLNASPQQVPQLQKVAQKSPKKRNQKKNLMKKRMVRVNCL